MSDAMLLADPFGLAALAALFGLSVTVVAVLLVIVALWSLIWKALALWHAARNRQKGWFIALLIVNTAGLLEIIYLVWFKKDRNAAGPASWFSKDAPSPTGEPSV